ncbi:hypothetical protein ES703_74161 [subsurface metagenome]
MNIPEIIKEFASSISVTHLICLAGLILFGGWLLKTSLGRNALSDSVPRRNNMPAYLPFILLFLWWGAVGIAIYTTVKALPNLPDWQSAFLANSIFCTGAIAGITVIIFLARGRFARRLKGFGLDAKTIHKDFFAAVLNLLSVWPLVLLTIVLTTFFGQLIWGQDFHLQQHEELKTIIAHPQLPLRALILVTSIAVVPAFEEMLFRGLFQTMLRSFLGRPWLSIALSSGLFATVHANAGHWPALFVLAVCLGYSYEKSGSLFRPIFIHSLFNAVTITAALYSG